MSFQTVYKWSRLVAARVFQVSARSGATETGALAACATRAVRARYFGSSNEKTLAVAWHGSRRASSLSHCKFLFLSALEVLGGGVGEPAVNHSVGQPKCDVRGHQ